MFKESLKKAIQELEELDKEWDRLDSTGQSELQRQITLKMEILQKEIEGLKTTIKLLNK